MLYAVVFIALADLLNLLLKGADNNKPHKPLSDMRFFLESASCLHSSLNTFLLK